MEASTLFRAVKPFNFKLPKPIPLRFSSTSSAPTIHPGKIISAHQPNTNQKNRCGARLLDCSAVGQFVPGENRRSQQTHLNYSILILSATLILMSFRFSNFSDNVGKRKRAYDGLLLDAGGTLLQLAKPVEETYLTIGRKFGLQSTATDIKQGFKRAFSAPWPEKLRYQGDGKPFWKLVVSEATGCDDADYFEEVYEYYANGDAWHLPEGAHETMLSLKNSGVKLAVVSNFDSRLRKLLKDLNVLDLFDSVIISSEVGYEKPDGKIFRAALDEVCVESCKAVHVGDDSRADKAGANAVGIECWLWGKDVKSFADIQNRILPSAS